MPDANDILRTEGVDGLRAAFEGGRRPVPDDAGADDPRPPDYSDEALALRFTDEHGQRLRYTAAWGRWHEWDGARWRPDETLSVYDKARHICRSAAAEARRTLNKKGDAIATAVASAKTVAAVERLARSDRRHAATVDQWDADPWLLNTPAGTVDLRSGRTRPNNPADNITKATAVAPSSAVPATWLATLDRITGGDAELIAFVQRVAGYSLTGSTREHALFFGYGTGANGKGTVLNALTGILGDYAATASMEVFTASTGDRHPTDLAMLRGARLVTAQETEEGRRWAEAKIKSMTGGDPITARFMRQDFFTFVPQFKLLIAGNHKPGLRGVDEAIRRRFHLIPFAVTIPPEERDPTLPDRLRAEWPGILGWALEGCQQWQRVGLAPPASVRAATEHYLSDQDSIAAWIEEACDLGPNYQDRSAVLFASWKTWAERAGEFAGSNKRFTEQLESRGFWRVRSNSGALFQGLRLRPTDDWSR